MGFGHKVLVPHGMIQTRTPYAGPAVSPRTPFQEGIGYEMGNLQLGALVQFDLVVSSLARPRVFLSIQEC